MNIKTSLIFVLSFFLAENLDGQNLTQYKFMGKVNLSDFLFMGRYTFEGEIPILKNSSLLINLGMHRKDYFYDNRDWTYSNPGMFRITPAIFPTKNILGWNTGFGMRQYLKIKEDMPPIAFLEIKGTYRISDFQKDFTVYVNSGSGGGGSQDHRVSGNQQLYAVYLGIGRTTIFNNKKVNVDMSFGFTQNFVKLNACRNGCFVPSWAWPPFLNPDGSLPTSSEFQAFTDEYYQAKEAFMRFRAEVKLTFFKRKNIKYLSY